MLVTIFPSSGLDVNFLSVRQYYYDVAEFVKDLAANFTASIVILSHSFLFWSWSISYALGRSTLYSASACSWVALSAKDELAFRQPMNYSTIRSIAEETVIESLGPLVDCRMTLVGSVYESIKSKYSTHSTDYSILAFSPLFKCK